MRINPGRLREVVQLQQLVTATDAVGNQTADWQTAATLRCRVNSLYGEDYWAAAAQNQQDTLVLCCAGARCWPLPWRTVT